jgi:hypothetical protein
MSHVSNPVVLHLPRKLRAANKSHEFAYPERLWDGSSSIYLPRTEYVQISIFLCPVTGDDDDEGLHDCSTYYAFHGNPVSSAAVSNILS